MRIEGTGEEDIEDCKTILQRAESASVYVED